MTSGFLPTFGLCTASGLPLDRKHSAHLLQVLRHTIGLEWPGGCPPRI